MMEEGDKRLDQLFKKRLSDTDNSFAYNEEDWAKLEVLLNQKEKQQRFLIWMRIGATTAAALLLFIGWLVFKAETPSQNNDEKLAKTPKKLTESNQPIRPTDELFKSVKVVKLTLQKKKMVTLPNLQQDSSLPQNLLNVLASNNAPVVDSLSKSLTILTQSKDALTQPEENTIPEILPKDSLISNENTSRKKSRSSFAIGIIASTDINGVNSLKKNRVGSNYGLLISMSLTKKVTVQTGVSYAVKPYDIEYTYTNAYAYKVNPLSASANCKMLDIPLNIDYTVLNKPKNKIGIGAGLSSYIMLHENYQYNYAPTAKANTTKYIIADSKSYLWSMLNVTTTYQYKLNPTLGIMVQPYLKIPLKEVGYSDVKLHSAGVSVGMQLNIN